MHKLLFVLWAHSYFSACIATLTSVLCLHVHLDIRSSKIKFCCIEVTMADLNPLWPISLQEEMWTQRECEDWERWRLSTGDDDLKRNLPCQYFGLGSIAPGTVREHISIVQVDRSMTICYSNARRVSMLPIYYSFLVSGSSQLKEHFYISVQRKAIGILYPTTSLPHHSPSVPLPPYPYPSLLVILMFSIHTCTCSEKSALTRSSLNWPKIFAVSPPPGIPLCLCIYSLWSLKALFKKHILGRLPRFVIPNSSMFCT